MISAKDLERIQAEWDEAACRSCGWHGAFYEYDNYFEVEEAAGNRFVHVECLQDATHRGARIYLLPDTGDE